MKGHIRKRGDSYQLLWYMGKGPGGKKCYHSKTVHGTREQAQEELNRILVQIASDDYTAPTKITVSSYFRRWLIEAKSNLKESTWSWYEMIWRNHILPQIGHLKLAALSPLHVHTLYRKLGENGLSQASVHAVYRAIGRPLSQAAKWKLILSNPVTQTGRPKEPRRSIGPLSAEQVHRLLEASDCTGRRSLYLAAITTGMRQSELLGLRWSDVDLDRSVLRVTGSLDRSGKRDSPKTLAGFRCITMPKILTDALRKLKESSADSQYVWCTSKGTPIMHRNLHRQFKSLLRKADLPETVRFHDLRHTSATLLLCAGIHPKVVQARLGHSRFQTTLDTYSHVMPQLQRQAAEALDAILGSMADTREKTRKTSEPQAP